MTTTHIVRAGQQIEHRVASGLYVVPSRFDDTTAPSGWSRLRLARNHTLVALGDVSRVQDVELFADVPPPGLSGAAPVLVRDGRLYYPTGAVVAQFNRGGGCTPLAAVLAALDTIGWAVERAIPFLPAGVVLRRVTGGVMPHDAALTLIDAGCRFATPVMLDKHRGRGPASPRSISR